jgi:hypothetical protein
VVGALMVVIVGIAVSWLSAGSGGSDRTVAGPAIAGSPVHGSGTAAPSTAVFGNGRSTASGAASGSAPVAPTTQPPLPVGSVDQSAKVEADGSIALTIGDGTLQTVLARLTALATTDGGFVASTQAQVVPGGGDPSSGSIVLRVPESDFGSVVSAVQQDGRATSVVTTSTDVTGQYVDLQARITALEASRQQYLTIMAQASSIGDILAVQSQLDTLQSQIEQLQGQFTVLSDETTYGTLTVSLSEAGHRPVRPLGPGSGVAKAWDDGIGGFVSGFEWLIRIAGTTLFVLLLIGALLVLGGWAWRALRRRLL